MGYGEQQGHGQENRKGKISTHGTGTKNGSGWEGFTGPGVVESEGFGDKDVNSGELRS